MVRFSLLILVETAEKCKIFKLSTAATAALDLEESGQFEFLDTITKFWKAIG